MAEDTSDSEKIEAVGNKNNMDSSTRRDSFSARSNCSTSSKLNGEDAFRVDSFIAFKVVDLDENFRPELMLKSGQIVDLDSVNGVVTIKTPVTASGENVSKRAAIFREGMAAVCENGQEECEEMEKFEVKEYKISDLSEVRKLKTQLSG